MDYYKVSVARVEEEYWTKAELMNYLNKDISLLDNESVVDIDAISQEEDQKGKAEEIRVSREQSGRGFLNPPLLCHVSAYIALTLLKEYVSL